MFNLFPVLNRCIAVCVCLVQFSAMLPAIFFLDNNVTRRLNGHKYLQYRLLVSRFVTWLFLLSGIYALSEGFLVWEGSLHKFVTNLLNFAAYSSLPAIYRDSLKGEVLKIESIFILGISIPFYLCIIPSSTFLPVTNIFLVNRLIMIS